MFAHPELQRIPTRGECAETFEKDSKLEVAMSQISLTSFILGGKSANYGTITDKMAKAIRDADDKLIVEDDEDEHCDDEQDMDEEVGCEDDEYNADN